MEEFRFPTDEELKEIIKKEGENWRQSLYYFYVAMERKFMACVEKKGKPTKEELKHSPKEYYLKKLQEHLALGHYKDVANFAFCLEQISDVKDEMPK